MNAWRRGRGPRLSQAFFVAAACGALAACANVLGIETDLSFEAGVDGSFGEGGGP